MDGNRLQHDPQRPFPTNLTRGRARFRHAVEDLEEVPVRALVLIDRHGTGKASTEASGQPRRVASPHVKRAVAVALLAFVALLPLPAAPPRTPR